MKRIALAAALALATPFAHAARPSVDQVDAMLQAMDAQKSMQGILAQMETSTAAMAQGMLGKDATPDQLATFKRVMAEQQRLLQEAMRWERIAPVYRTVYTETFTAEEVEAMTRFYASAEGRSIMAKMPQALARTMQELQPMMQTLMQQVQTSVQKELAPPASAGSGD